MTSNRDQNFRINSSGTALDGNNAVAGVQPDTPLAYAAGDPASAGEDFVLHGTAYSNSVPGAATTTLYAIDSTVSGFVRIGGENGTPSPNGGQVSTLSSLGAWSFDWEGGFDMTSGTTAFAAFDEFGGSSQSVLYSINVTTGARTQLGAIPAAAGTVRDIAIEPHGTPGFATATLLDHESVGAATIVVTRANGATGAISVDYATSNGTAVAGSDYTARSGTLSFEEGETMKTISVPVVNDATPEGSETVNLTLSNPTGGARLGAAASATLTIVDNDAAQTLAFTTGDRAVSEAAGAAALTVRRSGGTNGAISVNYSTASGSATAGSDFTVSTGSLTFADGETTKTISVPIRQDGDVEGAESFDVQLSGASAGIGLASPSTTTVTVVDDDVTPEPVTVPVVGPTVTLAPPAVPADQSTPAPADRAAPVLLVVAPPAIARRALRRDRVSARFSCSEGCRTTAELRLGRRVIGRGTTTLSGAGIGRLGVRLDAVGRRAVARANARQLMLLVRAVDAAGNAATAAHRITLNRR